MKTEFEQLLSVLVSPLVNSKDDVSISSFIDVDETIVLQVLVSKDDLGRVIGKSGRTANAIRTIANASATRAGKKIKVEFDSFE